MLLNTIILHTVIKVTDMIYLTEGHVNFGFDDTELDMLDLPPRYSAIIIGEDFNYEAPPPDYATIEPG